MVSNLIVQFIVKGGPIMWPILICALAVVAVVGERIFWWVRESRRRDPNRMKAILLALEKNDLAEAQELAAHSKDAVIRMIHRGLAHAHLSLLGALEMGAGVELERAGRFLTTLDTLVTLGPLLGLLGTVTGLMRAFLHVGNAELSVMAVTGGIGEALIATACGLGIAIVALIPLNVFSRKLARLQFELETAANILELMLGPCRKQ